MSCLSRMRRSPSSVLLAALAVGLLASGCAGTESILMQDRALGSLEIGRVDLLPVDFYLHIDDVEATDETARDRLNQEVSESIEGWTRRFLSESGYLLGNRITWAGTSGARGFVPGRVIEDMALDLLDFINDEEPPEGLGDHARFVATDALEQLVAATSSDAVLYVNGKASVESEAKRTRKMIIAVCCFIISAAFLYLIFKQSKGSGSSGRSTALRPGSPRGGRHRPARMRAAARRPRFYGPNLHVGFYTPIFIHSDRRRPHGGYQVEEESDDELQGDRLWLSFTLVSSKDGRVLWHSRQVVNLDATDHTVIEELMAEMMQSFPELSGAASPGP